MSQATSTSTRLPGLIQSAPPCVLGVDTDTTLNFATAQRLRQLGYQFCVRYLSLSTPQAPGDLSAEEASLILRAGLALVPVQHVLSPGWKPTGSLGNKHGEAAIRNARQIGLPPGINVWCDLEGVAPGTSTQAVIDYCQTWYLAVASGDYIPGLYVGYDECLSSAELYDSLSFQHYWSAFMATPVDVRSVQMIQLNPSVQIAGVSFDVDVTQQDAWNGNVVWLASATPAAP